MTHLLPIAWDIFYAGITNPMNLTPTHIPPWLERLGVPLGLGGLVLGLGWYFFVAGVGTEIELRREQLEVLTREIGQGAGLEQQLQDRASRNRRLASRLESLKAALPRGERTARLLRRVQATATGSRLKVKGIRKMPGGEGETFSRRPHSLAVAGDYHDLGSFCEKLGQLAPIVSLEDLRISAAGPAASPHTLTADFTATLHLYKPAADPVEAPAEPVSPAQLPSYRYRARGRRDPFRLPPGPGPPRPAAAPAARPRGLKGQRISELRLVGLVEAGGRFRAMATGLRDQPFLLKKGDRLFDGRVLEVRKDGVVFSHRLAGAAGRKRSRRVVKKLHPAPEEAGHEN